MKKILLSTFTILTLSVLLWAGFLWVKLPGIVKTTTDLIDMAQQSHLDPLGWFEIRNRARTLPNVYPVSLVRSSFLEASDIVFELEHLKDQKRLLLENQNLSTPKVLNYFVSIRSLHRSLSKIESNLSRFPEMLLSADQREQRDDISRRIAFARERLGDVRTIESILQDMIDREERVLILLQNPNEPRPTGGFVGSVVLLDFGEDEIGFEFSDIYAYDRLVPPEAQLPAPEFFHGLSQTISLRDANFFPDFETSAKAYMHFFKSADQKIPKTVIAINVSAAQEILRLLGPVSLDKWDITANAQNVDLVLQFLLGSQIEGRFGVKGPVLMLMQEIISIDKIQNVSTDELLAFDWEGFLEQKNLLGYSEHDDLQEIFEKWNLDGHLRMEKDADNFLHFDFVSVGANKSEKFMWTKIEHNSRIHNNGKVENTLRLRRSHALKDGEIQDLLGTDSWSPNVRALLTSDLMWVLGAGQNRTILRIYLPRAAELVSYQNPSGPLNQNFSRDGQFRVYEIPMYISPGETLDIELGYLTQIRRGNYDARPYNLQVSGTPAKQKTTFLSTISTAQQGRFTAETFTIGRPQPLIDQNYRAVVDFLEQ